MGIWEGEVTVACLTSEERLTTSVQSDPSIWGYSNTFIVTNEATIILWILTVAAVATIAAVAIKIYYTKKRKKLPA